MYPLKETFDFTFNIYFLFLLYFEILYNINVIPFVYVFVCLFVCVFSTNDIIAQFDVWLSVCMHICQPPRTPKREILLFYSSSIFFSTIAYYFLLFNDGPKAGLSRSKRDTWHVWCMGRTNFLLWDEHPFFVVFNNCDVVDLVQ